MKKIDYKIERLDRFAQGIHFGEKTTFISRALPGEQGVAEIIRSAKGVEFGKVESTLSESISPLRREPDCIHFNECQGCHYRHINYDEELNFKRKSFTYELKSFFNESHSVEVLALDRNGYRNRIQLHYHKKYRQLGFLNKVTKKIEPVPECKLPNHIVSKKLESLYRDQQWLALAKNKPTRGHLEIYEKNGTAQIIWNQRYAHGGFTQVNTKLNDKLYEWIKKNIASPNSYKLILDLFGGNGNISNSFTCDDKRIVDLYDKKTRESLEHPFYHLNLEEAQPFEDLSDIDLMIIDPPRRGFLKIDSWVQSLSPKHILYISCDIGSLKRDLKKLAPNYQIEKSLMIDFFGGTYHYESLVFLSRTT